MNKKKIGIIFDSSCGYTKKEIEAMEFYFVPIIIEVDGKEYYSGININNNFLLKQLKNNAKVKTAALKLGELKKTFDSALNKYEQVLFVSISKHISSTNETAKTLAKDYNGKVIVYDSEFITPWIKERIPEIYEVWKKEASLEEIIKIIDKQKGNMKAMVTPNNLEFLHKGGRITKSQYLTGSLLKIIPTIIVNNGAIDKNDVLKTRTLNKAYDKMIEETLREKEYLDSLGFNTKVAVLNINEKSNFKTLKQKLNNKGIKNILETTLAPEIVAHLGPQAVGIGVFIL